MSEAHMETVRKEEAKEASPGIAGVVRAVLSWAKTGEGLAILGAGAALAFAFFPLLALLPSFWLDFDGYYAHGLLVVPGAAYIIWQRWERIKDIPVKGSVWALVVLLPTLYVTVLANRTVMPLLLSILFMMALLSAIWFVAGWRWMWALAPGVLFIMLGFPLLDRFIDSITFKLQLISTDTAEIMLKLSGQEILRLEPTVLRMNNFDLNIAEACSGLKTTIAVTAIVLFFMLTTPLKWWAHTILAAMAIPLSILVNGFRIALIGLVGNSQGHEAGLAFHDWSGYIALAVCFFVILQVSKWMETGKGSGVPREARA
jgi:exosortase